jgi:hypothetical protein
MNKKRKLLTLVALIAFGAMIFFHYYGWHWQFGFGQWPVFPDIRMPLFELGVFYAGLFFLLGGKDAEAVPRPPPPPRNWRRITVIDVIVAGLVVIVLVIAAVFDSHERKEATRQTKIELEERTEVTRQANIELAKRKEATRQAEAEEASKHRIPESEIDLIDLRLERNQGHTLQMKDFRTSEVYGYHLTARIRNRSAHNLWLDSFKLTVTLREKEGSQDIVGEHTEQIRVEVPPHQTREINQTIYFDNSPQLTQYAWTYVIAEIRGGGDSTVFDPWKYIHGF